MILDSATQEGLEIFNNTPEDEENVKTQKLKFSCLADLMDNTTTPFGRRLLKKWLSAPLIDTE